MPSPLRPSPAVPAPRRGRQRAAGAAFGLLLLVVATAAAAYLLAPYTLLRDWYLRLTPDLYRAGAWPQEFFMPDTKVQGNWLAVGLPATTPCRDRLICTFMMCRAHMRPRSSG